VCFLAEKHQRIFAPLNKHQPKTKNIQSKKEETMKKILVFAIAAVSFAFCDKNEGGGGKESTLKGPEVAVHGGKAWTWVKTDKQGNPLKVGITLDAQAMNTVPIGNNGSGHNHGTGNDWVVKFSDVAGAIVPFNFVGLNWNPNGHEPEHIYDKPHFDFHFYSQTPEEVMAIPAYEVDSAKFKNVPAADYFPANYINPGGGIPMMGAHWLDVTSGELNGKPFTETFIFGSYDGKVTFYEPMITHEFLKSQTNYERVIPAPAKFQKDGWYPTVMRIVQHDGLTDIVLDKMVYRHKS
jgi:hypothetical protein